LDLKKEGIVQEYWDLWKAQGGGEIGIAHVSSWSTKWRTLSFLTIMLGEEPGEMSDKVSDEHTYQRPWHHFHFKTLRHSFCVFSAHMWYLSISSSSLTPNYRSELAKGNEGLWWSSFANGALGSC